MVVYSLTDSAGGSFSIDASSGIVVLERVLDREVQPAYQITVRASDQGSPQPLSSLVNVTITVLDINDNPPVFERRDQLATVPEDVGVGTEVLRVYAASKDIGTNAEISYSIRSGNEHGKFHIHPLTGDSTKNTSFLYAMYFYGFSNVVELDIKHWLSLPHHCYLSISIWENYCLCAISTAFPFHCHTLFTFHSRPLNIHRFYFYSMYILQLLTVRQLVTPNNARIISSNPNMKSEGIPINVDVKCSQIFALSDFPTC